MPRTRRKQPERTIDPAGSYTLAPANVEPKKASSTGEERFALLWNETFPDLPFETEYQFHALRKWRLDFAWPQLKVAVEFEGYGHGKENRYKTDLDKYNALAYRGWRLFRCTASMLTAPRYKGFLTYVQQALCQVLLERQAGA